MGRRRESEHACLVVCPPGLEGLIVEELLALGARPGRKGRGSVSVNLTPRRLYATNVFLRCATRVLVRVEQFTARSFADLERQISALDWSPWISSGVVPRFRVTMRHSKLWHEGAVAERFAKAFGTGQPSKNQLRVDELDRDSIPLIVVRGVDDRFTVSIDSSGKPLHERGWRQATAKAPLRESVAAGLLASASWDPATPLVDPMCGSGTIAIEAALIAAGVAAGADRDLAFRSWPSFEPGTWASVAEEVSRCRDKALVTDGIGIPRILAADRDAGAIEAARSNAERAGVAACIEFRVAPISALEIPKEFPPGLLATNPPWGGRLAGGDLRNLYATLGQVAAKRCQGWGIGVLAADRALARQVRPGLTERLHLELGGRSAFWLTGWLPRVSSSR